MLLTELELSLPAKMTYCTTTPLSTTCSPDWRTVRTSNKDFGLQKTKTPSQYSRLYLYVYHARSSARTPKNAAIQLSLEPSSMADENMLRKMDPVTQGRVSLL